MYKTIKLFCIALILGLMLTGCHNPLFEVNGINSRAVITTEGTKTADGVYPIVKVQLFISGEAYSDMDYTGKIIPPAQENSIVTPAPRIFAMNLKTKTYKDEMYGDPIYFYNLNTISGFQFQITAVNNTTVTVTEGNISNDLPPYIEPQWPSEIPKPVYKYQDEFEVIWISEPTSNWIPRNATATAITPAGAAVQNNLVDKFGLLSTSQYMYAMRKELNRLRIYLFARADENSPWIQTHTLTSSTGSVVTRDRERIKNTWANITEDEFPVYSNPDPLVWTSNSNTSFSPFRSAISPFGSIDISKWLTGEEIPVEEFWTNGGRGFWFTPDGVFNYEYNSDYNTIAVIKMVRVK